MKTLSELAAIRDKVKKEIDARGGIDGKTRVMVGMATCGIAAGARPVLTAFVDEIAKENLKNISVLQTGCVGLCDREPFVDVITPDGAKTTYVDMTPEKAIRVVHSHLIGGEVVGEYLLNI